jgi:hypothetical protein
VIDVLSFILRGIPAHIRSDNGPEFVAKTVQFPTLRRLVVPQAMPSLLACMRGIEAEADWASATYAAATLVGIAPE